MNRIAVAFPLLVVLVAFSFPAGAGEESSSDLVVALARREVEAYRAADLVVVGKLVELCESPRVWCGYVATRQFATFAVQAVLAGKEKPGEVTVGFYLVSGSPLVAKEPWLAPDLFRPGSRWLLCLKKDEERYIVQDEAFGARLLESPPAAPPERTAVLRAVLDGPALKGYLHPEGKDRVPLIVLENEAVTPPPVLHAHGEPVWILPRDRIGKRPYLELTSVEIEGYAATVGLSYPVEGLIGSVDLRNSDGVWRTVRNATAEK